MKILRRKVHVELERTGEAKASAHLLTENSINVALTTGGSDGQKICAGREQMEGGKGVILDENGASEASRQEKI